MESSIDIHNFRQLLEAEEKKILVSNISEQNKRDLLRFRDDLHAKGLSIPRILKYLNTLRVVSRMLGKDFTAVNKELKDECLFMLKLLVDSHCKLDPDPFRGQ